MLSLNQYVASLEDHSIIFFIFYLPFYKIKAKEVVLPYLIQHVPPSNHASLLSWLQIMPMATLYLSFLPDDYILSKRNISFVLYKICPGTHTCGLRWWLSRIMYLLCTLVCFSAAVIKTNKQTKNRPKSTMEERGLCLIYGLQPHHWGKPGQELKTGT